MPRAMTELRLLPLLSSATEIVHALGLGKYQVGRSHECDYPPCVLDLPVCSEPTFPVDGSSAEIDRLVKDRLRQALSIYQLDHAAIRALQPTHIITQTQCKVCAVSLDDVEKLLQDELSSPAEIIALEPYALADLWRDIERIAGRCNHAQNGAALIEQLKTQMREIEKRAKTAATRPTVAAIEWLEPLMSAGNWIPELIEMAGGENLFGIAGQHSPWMTWQEIIEADPDILIALPCGFDITRTRNEMHWLAGRKDWQSLRAVKNGKVFVCEGNQFMNRPGPRLVESLRIFAEIIHPELIPPQMERSGWQRFPD